MSHTWRHAPPCTNLSEPFIQSFICCKQDGAAGTRVSPLGMPNLRGAARGLTLRSYLLLHQGS